ncbi:MAG: PAS domain S-box protein [Pseudomonadota bacterium]
MKPFIKIILATLASLTLALGLLLWLDYRRAPRALPTWSESPSLGTHAVFFLLALAALFFFLGRCSKRPEASNNLGRDEEPPATTLSENLQDLFQRHKAMMFLIDAADLRILDVNRATQAFYGYSREEFVLKRLPDIHVIPEDELKAELQAAVMENRAFMSFKHRLASGEVRDMEIRSTPLTTADGTKKYLAVVHDVTEQKLVEENLRVSEAQYRVLAEYAPLGLWQYGPHGENIYLNPAMMKMLRIESTNELREKSIFRFPVPDRPTEPFVLETEVEGDKSDKTNVIIHGAPIFSSENSFLGVIAFFVDITEFKRMEERLLQSQKMEAIGSLASGVAHDFNNILQAISGFVQLMMLKCGQDPVGKRYLWEIDLAVDRASSLVNRLLTFGRKVQPELKPLDLNREILHTVELLERTIPKMIGIQTVLSGNLHQVWGDSNQLEQVLMNLGTNARDAMPLGGRILIETQNIRLDESRSGQVPELPAGDYALIKFSDTGEGIDEKTRPHVFEPFFTTKKTGRGTGLGLSTVYGIVKTHNGHIACESLPEKGTQFSIFLPALKTAVGEQAADQPEIEGPDRGEENILVVDDERAVLEIAVDVLTDAGYRVEAAQSGEEALDIFRRDPGKFHLVLLDLGMPGMGGRACLEELIRLNPRIKVVIASGYSLEDGPDSPLRAGARKYVRKPYRLNELLREVRRTIDEAPD